MKRLLFVLAFLVLATTAHAQTTTANATWAQTESPAVAQAFVATMKIDTGTPVTITQVCTPAVSPATGSICVAPLTVTTPTTLHSYVLMVCNASFCASMSTSGNAPGTGGLKINVTTTVTVTSGDDEGTDPWL